MKGMFRGFALLVLLLSAFVVTSAEPAQDVASAAEAKLTVAAQAVDQAEAKGVFVGRAFEPNTVRSHAAFSLLETNVAGASCQVTCSGGKVAGIVCNVGEMCQCSCMGGGPDCSCRNSN